MVLFCLSPSPFLSLSRIVFEWHPNANPLCLGTFFILGHLPLILLLFTFSSMIRKPVRTSWRTSPNVVFIRNAAWFYQTFLILLYLLSLQSGMRISMWDTRELSHGDHMGVLLQYAWFWYFHTLFVTQIQGTRIVVTPKLISEVLIILRVSHPDYPTCPHLRTMSKDKLLSLFCETPSSWGECQNTLCLGFVKGPRFLNMEMTFVLHHLSHYNSITEPCAHFLLSLIEDLTIDLPSHFILSHRCL